MGVCMSQLSTYQNVYQLVDAQQTFFEEAGDYLDWGKERHFAGQLLSANDFTTKVAMNNPSSVISAITNLSATGLSLNPATKYAYLVPREGKICLDISYMGLVKIATDSGAIRWVKAEPVYSNDKFTYKGVSTEPEIECDPGS